MRGVNRLVLSTRACDTRVVNKRRDSFYVSAALALALAALGFVYVDYARDVDSSRAWKAAPEKNHSLRIDLCPHFERILPGKTEAEVLALLGEPEMRGEGFCGIRFDEHEKLTYSMNDSRSTSRLMLVFVVRLKNGRVISANTATWGA